MDPDPPSSAAPEEGGRDAVGRRPDLARSVAELRSRARGCLLAGALGDALGAPIEFMPLPMIRGLYGARGLDSLNVMAARVPANAVASSSEPPV